MSKRVADTQIIKDGVEGGGDDLTSNIRASAAQLAKRKIIQPRGKLVPGASRPAISPSFPPPSMSFPPATQPAPATTQPANSAQPQLFQSSSFNFASQPSQPIFGTQAPATNSGFTGSMFNIPAAQPSQQEAGTKRWPPKDARDDDVPTWAPSSPYHFGENLATTTPVNGLNATSAANGFGTHQGTNGAAVNGASTADLNDIDMQTSPQAKQTSPETKPAAAEPKSLFGTLTQEPAKEVKSLFGNTTTTTQPAAQPQGLFGAPSTPKPAAESQGLFGTAATSKPATESQPLFGSSAATTQPAADLSGNVGTSTTKPATKFVFGQTSDWGKSNPFTMPNTTPALVPRDPSSPNLFAPKTANDAPKEDSVAVAALKNDLFGPQTPKKDDESQKGPQATSNAFTPAPFPSTTTAAPQTANLFAPKPSVSSAESSTVPQTPATGKLFAPKGPVAAPPAQAPSSNLFTPQTSKPVTDAATTISKPQAPLFGSSMQTPTPSTNIFGAAQTPAQTNMFASSKPPGEDSEPAKTNLFAPASTNMFNQASSQAKPAENTPKPASSSLFQPAQTPASNLFAPKPVDLSKFQAPSATPKISSQPPALDFGNSSNTVKETPAKPSFQFGQSSAAPAFTPSQTTADKPRAENPFANMHGGSMTTNDKPTNGFALTQTKDVASQVPSPSTALVPFANNPPPPQVAEHEEVEIDYTIQNIMATLEIPQPPPNLGPEQRDQYDLGFKLIALQKAAKAHVTEKIFNLESISQPFINALNQQLAELKRGIRQSKRKADIEDDQQTAKRVKISEQAPPSTPSKTSSNTSRLFASIANGKTSTPARSSPLKNVQNASPIPATPGTAGRRFIADFSMTESDEEDEEGQEEEQAQAPASSTGFTPSSSNNLFSGFNNATSAKFEPPKFSQPSTSSTPFKFGEPAKVVEPPKAIEPPKFTMPSSTTGGPGSFLSQFGKTAELSAAKDRAKRKAEEYDSEEETEEQYEERAKREQTAKRAKFAEDAKAAPGFVFKPSASAAGVSAPKSPTKNQPPKFAPPQFGAGTATNFFAEFGKAAADSAAKEKSKRKAEDYDSEEETEEQWEERDTQEQEAKRLQLQEAGKNAQGFRLAAQIPSPSKAAGPPKFAPPQFGTSGPVNFMAEFSKSAEETAAKEKAKRMDEDYDSEEETKEEWLERYEKEQAEKRAKLAEAAKSAPGFTFKPTTTATPASTVETTSVPTKPASPVKANPLFVPSNTSASPLAPPLFGSSTPAAKPSTLFNSLSRNAETPKPATGLFGSAPSASKPLFGSSTPPSKPLFGSSAPAAQPTTNLFGKAQTPMKSSPPAATVADDDEEEEDEDEEGDDEEEDAPAPTNLFGNTPDPSTVSGFGMLGNQKTTEIPKTAVASSANLSMSNPFAGATKPPMFGSGSNPFMSATSGFGAPFGTPAKQAEASEPNKTWTPANPIKFGGDSTTTPATAAKPGLLFPETPLTSATPSLFQTTVKPAGNSMFGGVAQATSTTNPFAQKSLPPGTGLFGSAPKPFGASLNNAVLSNVTSRASTPADGQGQDEESTEGNDEDAAEPEAQIDLIAGAGGEENEDLLFTVRAKARVLVPLGNADGANGWETRGVGTLKLLKNKDTGKTRLLLRAEPSAKVVLNTNLIKTMKYQEETGAKNTIGFGAPNAEGKMQRWLITVKTADLSAELAKELEAAK